MMVDPLGNERNYGFLKTAMDASSRRHEVYAANIANIDTPGFKARDMDFNAIMQDYLNVSQGDLSTEVHRQAGVRPPQIQSGFDDYVVTDESSAITERFDGNNVDLDKQMANIASNSARYRMANQFLNSRARLLNDLLRS